MTDPSLAKKKATYFCWLHCLTLACWLLLAQAAFAAATFETWWEQSQAQRSEERQRALERAEVLGLSIIYEEIHAEMRDLSKDSELNQRERDWTASFMQAMELCWTPDGPAAGALLHALEHQDRHSAPAAIAQDLRRSFREHFTCNPYDPAPSQVDPTFLIFEQRPDMEIRIQPEETSEVAQTLWLNAEILQSLLNQENLVLMQDTSAAIAAANRRWQNFQRHALADQFPWETLTNGWLGERFEALGGTLAHPPRTQLRLIHPLPLAAVTLEGKTAFKPRLGVEALGLRRYEKETYAAHWGVSALLIMPGDRQENLGYGALLLYRKASIGIGWQDDEDGRDGLVVVLGIDLAELINNKGRNLRQKVQQVRQSLYEVGERIGN
ncbi:hypothetical protein SAMN05660860_01215 [Geoalkalibacter ferrihydriticus]|uniref:CHASE domain-containing protein n=2 Tax=Geoalkalibacter ferrihydriticus TaxID=392333 RepID=A0A0C2DWB3_9BACT|nr:hypothetical protein [Geoalkalibacter ferrihydriticus]KIH77729.1 hypothetical protein GFER_03490 [Geoalkalibacter ferrihydriticus DSM 17813]SDL76123.1 hypothetical protein SAMN05660860_01215 [Geoalkalibacter ferrihydriticus]